MDAAEFWMHKWRLGKGMERRWSYFKIFPHHLSRLTLDSIQPNG